MWKFIFRALGEVWLSLSPSWRNALLLWSFLQQLCIEIYKNPTFGWGSNAGLCREGWPDVIFAQATFSLPEEGLSFYQLYGNSRSHVLSLTRTKCCSYLFPRLVTVPYVRPSVCCCLTGPKHVPSSWDARHIRWHRVAHVISLPHSLWTWGL